MKKVFSILIMLFCMQSTYALNTQMFVVKRASYTPCGDSVILSRYSSDYHYSTSGRCGDGLSWVLNEETGVLSISGIGKMRNYEMDPSPWEGNENIKTIVIEFGVTSVGSQAFYNCTELSSVVIPNTVVSIGEGAFGGCANLTSIALPNSLVTIGGAAFSRCCSLNSIIIPENVKKIGYFVFSNSNNLTEIYYPEQLDVSKIIHSSAKLIAYTPEVSPTIPKQSPVTSANSSNTNVACTILNPSDYNTYYSKSPISMRYKVENLSEGQTIEYYVDDPKRSVPIQGTKGVRIEQGAELKIEMPQYGKHVVGIRVVDSYGTRTEDTRIFAYRSIHKPTLHVFAVGVNKYKAKGFNELRYAEKDARDFSKTIIDIADKNMYERVDTTLLLDIAANRNNLEEQLIELIGRVQADDVVMLFFSGHGVNINGDSYFLTSEAKDPLRGLSFHFINQRIKDMKAKGGHILIFMDACHSGGMGNAKGSTSKSITLAEPGAIGYYSCSEDQTSIEKEELKNGVFTYALIEGMKGSKYGQQITMWGLYNIILEIVKEENKNQYPRLLHDKEIDNDYVIFYKKK